MAHIIKKRLYFLVAAYFAFWAKIVLRRWQPRIVVITGSTGKTTLLHLVEAQLGTGALYSHHANSAFGIPFHILGITRKKLTKGEWPWLLLSAPFRVFKKIPATKLYIVEADCDRPHEGQFLAELLHPEVVLWVSVYRTHSMNFDKLVHAGTFMSHEQAIAYEFGYFVASATKLVAVNGDQSAIVEQLKRVALNVPIIKASTSATAKYNISGQDTIFTLATHDIRLPGLQPKELTISLQLVDALLNYLDKPLDPYYHNFKMPPGRSSIFKGIHGSILIDSTYNTGLGATAAVLQLFDAYPNKHKWVVLGDILEQGSLEEAEHKGLAKLLETIKFEHVILLGPRTKSYTFPQLKNSMPDVPIVSFESPKEVLEYMKQNIKGGEAILFKGGRFLEGVIEQLLANSSDAIHLVRREPLWIKRRQKWGLPR